MIIRITGANFFCFVDCSGGLWLLVTIGPFPGKEVFREMQDMDTEELVHDHIIRGWLKEEYPDMIVNLSEIQFFVRQVDGIIISLSLDPVVEAEAQGQKMKLFSTQMYSVSLRACCFISLQEMLDYLKIAAHAPYPCPYLMNMLRSPCFHNNPNHISRKGNSPITSLRWLSTQMYGPGSPSGSPSVSESTSKPQSISSSSNTHGPIIAASPIASLAMARHPELKPWCQLPCILRAAQRLDILIKLFILFLAKLFRIVLEKFGTHSSGSVLRANQTRSK